MSSSDDIELAPEHWWLYRVMDAEHYVFAYEYATTVLCHIQRPEHWLVRMDRADGTILFSQHELRSRENAFALGESVMELCSTLHREVVAERSQLQQPVYTSSHGALRRSKGAVSTGAFGSGRRPMDVHRRRWPQPHDQWVGSGQRRRGGRR